MVEQIFLSPQVKKSVIISNKLVYTSCLMRCRTTYIKNIGKKTSKKLQNQSGISENFIKLLPRF